MSVCLCFISLWTSDHQCKKPQVNKKVDIILIIYFHRNPKQQWHHKKYCNLRSTTHPSRELVFSREELRVSIPMSSGQFFWFFGTTSGLPNISKVMMELIEHFIFLYLFLPFLETEFSGKVEVPSWAAEWKWKWFSACLVCHRHSGAATSYCGDPYQDTDISDQAQAGLYTFRHRLQVTYVTAIQNQNYMGTWS